MIAGAQRSVRGEDRFGATAGAAAVALGLLAFIADLVEGIAGQLLIALTSSGFAWGLAAFLIGRIARDHRRAAIAGATVLGTATLIYYLLVLLVSRRWSGAQMIDPATGLSVPADAYGLRSIAITAGLWLVGSAVAGPLMALLGQTVRSQATDRAALAAGVGCGLLSGEGWHSAWAIQVWQLDLNPPYGAEFARGLLASVVIRLVLPVVVLVWLATAHRLKRAWLTLLVATVLSAAASALLWAGIQHARNLL